MDVSFQGTFLSDSPLCVELPDEELIERIEDMKKENKIMEIENDIFENFLYQFDPKLLHGMKTILDQANRIRGQMEHAQTSLPSDKFSLSRSVSSVTSLQSRISSFSMDQGRRVNLQTRIDLVHKERDSMMKAMETFHKNAKIKRNSLRAELEEINLRITETREAREIFEQTIVKNGVDKLTQKIPAEKFIRYMEEWLKSAESIIEKLRLKTSNLKYKKIFLQNQLKQKEELGESLNPVDLDELKIEHRILNNKLEEKNADLLELKKKTGQANLTLSKQKKFLHSQLKILNKLIHEINKKKEKTVDLQNEIISVEHEVEMSEEKLNYIEKIIQSYSVPDIMEYIQIKKDVDILQRNVKIWRRRNSIQKNTLESCIKTMKRLTRSKTECPSWYKLPEKKSVNDNENEDDD